MYKKLIKMTGLWLVVLAISINVFTKITLNNTQILDTYLTIGGLMIITLFFATIYKSGKFIINKINE